jgi:hypothetical protein
MTDPTIAAIAAKLTPAQAQAVRMAGDFIIKWARDRKLRGLSRAGLFHLHETNETTNRTLNSLCDKGLMDLCSFGDDRDVAWRLSAKGRAVLAHLDGGEG